MELPLMFQKLHSAAFHSIREYQVPKVVFPTPAIIHHNPKSPSKRLSYIDEQVHPFADNPSPAHYRSLSSMATKATMQTRTKLKDSQPDRLIKQRAKSVQLLKTAVANAFRKTYVDDIENFQKKYKPPGVGKYSSKHDKSLSSSNRSITFPKTARSAAVLDQVSIIASEVPGCGTYDPKPIQQKLKPNLTDFKFWIQKHTEQAKSVSMSKIGPTSYSPRYDRSFDRNNKLKKAATSMKLVSIDRRKGLNSQFKTPSSGSYSKISQWAQIHKPKQKMVGKLRLIEQFHSSPRKRIYN